MFPLYLLAHCHALPVEGAGETVQEETGMASHTRDSGPRSLQTCPPPSTHPVPTGQAPGGTRWPAAYPSTSLRWCCSRVPPRRQCPLPPREWISSRLHPHGTPETPLHLLNHNYCISNNAWIPAQEPGEPLSSGQLCSFICYSHLCSFEFSLLLSSQSRITPILCYGL